MCTVLANLGLIGTSLALLVHLGLISRYGAILIREPNELIPGVEIAARLALIGLGVYNLIKMRKEVRHGLPGMDTR